MKNKTKSDNALDSKSSTLPTTTSTGDGIWEDARFAHLVKDPRFKGLHKSTQKIKIDQRFDSMFKDDKFKLKYSVDKYGRPVKKSSVEDLKKYYDLSSENEEDEQKEEEKAISAVDLNDDLENDEEIPAVLKNKLKNLSVDYARGEGALLSDDSSDDESSSDDEEGKDSIFIEHVWGELDVDAPRTDESTRRLAVCNMDWDRIRAADIMVLCNSFLPPAGVILSVTIYPSEYGKERMAEEELKGPQELTEKKLESNDENSDADDDKRRDFEDADDGEEGSDYNMEKLRQYQLNRLKYYYGVIECNNVFTADKIYSECDGLEYESTATKLDLRFIPDDMTFDEEPKDVCTELPDISKYQPRLFTTTALQQAKVELTWDENDVERKELNEKLMSGKLNEVADQELRKYVAYSSEDEDDTADAYKLDVAASSTDLSDSKPDSNPIMKYKALLADINEKEIEKKNNRTKMEFSWGIGVKNDKSRNSESSNAKQRKEPEQTHFEKILEKKKEKKRTRKEEQKKLRKKYRKGASGDGATDDSSNSDDDDDDELPDGIDLNDPYFAEEFENGDFEAPKKTKRNKKKTANVDVDADAKDKQKAAELALLLDDNDPELSGKPHFNLTAIQELENESKSKRRRKKALKSIKKQNEVDKKLLVEDNFQINTGDNRFADVYTSHLFNIDPTHPQYKKTKGMEAIIEEKLKRRHSGTTATTSSVDDSRADQPTPKKSKQHVQTNMLVKRIKQKLAHR